MSAVPTGRSAPSASSSVQAGSSRRYTMRLVRAGRRLLRGGNDSRLLPWLAPIRPQGRQRWTLELLCEQAVKQGLVESVGKSEVALWLKEHDLKPWRKKLGAFPS